MGVAAVGYGTFIVELPPARRRTTFFLLPCTLATAYSVSELFNWKFGVEKLDFNMF